MAEFIKIYENAISNELCDKLMLEINTNPTIATRADESWRRCLMLSYPNNLIIGSENIFNQVKSQCRELFNKFKDDIGQNGGKGTLNFCSLIEKPNIILYIPNDKKQEMFHDHSDNWSQDSSTRQVSVILYLNDVEEGGCTVFPYYNMSVKPKKGSILMFPSFYTYTHHAEPPISNPKYIMVTWIHFGNGSNGSNSDNGTKYFTYKF